MRRDNSADSSSTTLTGRHRRDDAFPPPPVDLSSLVGGLPLPVVVHDVSGQVVYANPAFAELLGYTVDQTVGLNARDVIHPDDLSARDALAAAISSGSIEQAEAERRLLHRDGSVISVRAAKSAVRVGSERLVMVCIQNTAYWTEQITRLEYAASHDELTLVLNRTGVQDVIARVQVAGRRGVVAVVDVDGLKLINDRWGHDVGDVVLRNVAASLQAADDAWVVGRWGGDEFVVIEVDGDRPLGPRIERTLMVAAEPVGEPARPIEASVGEAGFGPGITFDQARAAADARMYDCKRSKAGSD